jgi:hypothetical protein
MCNKYNIVKYATGTVNTGFKYDVLRTEVNSTATGTPYSAPASVIETKTLAADVYSV